MIVSSANETVLCKDTPAFIANRIGVFSIMTILQVMDQLQMTVDEVDALTGPCFRRRPNLPPSTTDVVGLDTMVKVANNTYEGLPR